MGNEPRQRTTARPTAAERIGRTLIVLLAALLGVSSPSLATDLDLSVEALREWIARENVPGTQIHDGLSWESELVRAFGVNEIPFSVVVGSDGSVVAVNEHGKRLEKAVKIAVRAKPGG